MSDEHSKRPAQWRSRSLIERTERSRPSACFPDQVCHIDRGFASGGIAQRDRDTAETKAFQGLAGHGAADALDNDIVALALRDPANALGETFRGVRSIASSSLSPELLERRAQRRRPSRLV